MQGAEAPFVKAARVVSGDRPVQDVLARMTQEEQVQEQLEGSHLVFLTARPGVTAEQKLTLQLLVDDGKKRLRLFPLLLVPEGDPRANAVALPQSIEEAKQLQGKKKKKLIVEESGVPTVKQTDPSPPVIYSDGEPQTLVFRGNLLDQINGVRLRPSSKPPKYRNEQGKIPFRWDKESSALSLELRATPDTAAGTGYAMDFFVDKYLVQTLEITVKHPAEKPAVQIETDTIALPPAIPTPPPAPDEIRLGR